MIFQFKDMLTLTDQKISPLVYYSETKEARTYYILFTPPQQPQNRPNTANTPRTVFWQKPVCLAVCFHKRHTRNHSESLCSLLPSLAGASTFRLIRGSSSAMTSSAVALFHHADGREFSCQMPRQ